MIVTDHLIYLQMQKTGSTYVERLLVQHAGGIQHGKHQRIPANFEIGNRLIVGSVRNPWEWYLSLWSYGCAGKGSLRNRLTHRLSLRHHGAKVQPAAMLSGIFHQLRGSPERWEAVYRSVADPQAFREWLKMILDPAARGLLGYGYAGSPISSGAGLYSYRLAQLYSKNLNALKAIELSEPERLPDYFRDGLALDAVIRLEQLEADLTDVLVHSGQAHAGELAQWLAHMPALNASKRPHSVRAYFDAASFDLISHRESAARRHFGYADYSLDDLND
jgi:hypothetical protein